ncbi:MAG: DUF29 domain-containing protein [Caulobacteraceae bacterium]|nr:DUF29 domain-containing protein [Caulobacteraceae bacterium]
MADDLYDVDFVAWTEAQAAALRARRSGANALDYDNLAEEIEDLGKSEQHACESFVENIIEHLLKIEFIGPRETIPHWRGEIVAFRNSLKRRLTKTIENRTRSLLPELFDGALQRLIASELLQTRDAVLSKLADGYAWGQITEPCWYPEPRYD